MSLTKGEQEESKHRHMDRGASEHLLNKLLCSSNVLCSTSVPKAKVIIRSITVLESKLLLLEVFHNFKRHDYETLPSPCLSH